jgi:hypothetical protein
MIYNMQRRTHRAETHRVTVVTRNTPRLTAAIAAAEEAIVIINRISYKEGERTYTIPICEEGTWVIHAMKTCDILDILSDRIARDIARTAASLRETKPYGLQLIDEARKRGVLEKLGMRKCGINIKNVAAEDVTYKSHTEHNSTYSLPMYKGRIVRSMITDETIEKLLTGRRDNEGAGRRTIRGTRPYGNLLAEEAKKRGFFDKIFPPREQKAHKADGHGLSKDEMDKVFQHSEDIDVLRREVHSWMNDKDWWRRFLNQATEEDLVDYLCGKGLGKKQAEWVMVRIRCYLDNTQPRPNSNQTLNRVAEQLVRLWPPLEELKRRSPDLANWDYPTRAELREIVAKLLI